MRGRGLQLFSLSCVNLKDERLRGALRKGCRGGVRRGEGDRVVQEEWEGVKGGRGKGGGQDGAK